VVISFTKRQTREFFKIPSSLSALEMRFNLGKNSIDTQLLRMLRWRKEGTAGTRY
jgi:hypothetical protein